jgi:hypothetical protein
MDSALSQAFKAGNVKGFATSTISGLISRGLLAEDESITPKGQRCVILQLSLSDQCKALGLNLVNLTLEFDQNPETACLSYYESMGYLGSACEGLQILTVLKALMLDKLAELNVFQDRADACARYLEAQLVLLPDHAKELIDAVSNTTQQKYLENFREIVDHPFNRDHHSGLSVQLAEALINHVAREVFTRLACKFSEAPYQYRAGWPDLTLIRGSRVKFVEVKTTDKLHESQLITIPVMRSILPFEFEVAYLSRSSAVSS